MPTLVTSRGNVRNGITRGVREGKKQIGGRVGKCAKKWQVNAFYDRQIEKRGHVY